MMSKLREQTAFLRQVGAMTKDEFLVRFPLGRPCLKSEGMEIRTADFYGVDPNGYDLFDSEDERLALLKYLGLD
jgi:hypothetical protein